MGILTDKVVLITGAAGGLGVHVTGLFLNAGATVVGSSRSIRGFHLDHPDFFAVAADLSRGDDAAKLAAEVVARFGRIDALVHLAGGFAGGSPVAATDDSTFESMLDLNLRAAFHVLRAVIPLMRSRGAGKVVAVGGRAAVEPGPMIGAYSASKAALLALMRSAASENLAHGINVNVVLPGTMDTPANRAADPAADFSKWVPPAKVASAILWLVSDDASHISGAAIPIYGRER